MYRLCACSLLRLFRGEKVETPIFDFVAGCPKAKGRPMQLPTDGVLIMEGIFCLNPQLTESIDAADKFSIYIAPMTQVRSLVDNAS